ncbi:MAG TPA: hypothetical protein VG028_10645 [Terriglobia bacterium]|nr:hypothetical protein [Terriglobia bacterium]
MILLRFIGLFLVLMAFYSFGAVAGSRTKSMTQGRALFPTLLDLAVILLAWLAASFASWGGYRAAVATMIGTGVGLFAAFILYRLLKQTSNQKPRVGAGGGKIPVPGIESSVPATPQSDDPVQPRWRSFLRQVGGFQSRLLLSGFYYVAILPFGILVGMLGDPLGLKPPPGESFWKRREDDLQNLERARRQS